MSLPRALFHRLPKTDLHCHLDGSLRIATLIELARQHRVPLPTFDPGELRRLLVAGDQVGSLDDYLRAFDITLRVLQEAEALERCAYELAEDAWRDNVRYLEVRYSPLLHTQQGVAPDRALEAVLRGLGAAQREHGIRTGVILCAIRTLEPASSLAVAELCTAFKHRGVVGLDLAGSEHDFPGDRHRPAFQQARDHNLNCTVHAGEASGPDSVHQALHQLGAHRIGHGTRVIDDPELLAYVVDHRIPLEVCPSSNVQTGAAASWARHPVAAFVEAGARVTINTDSRLISDTTVTDELARCHQHYGWTLETIKRVVLDGFHSAFLPYRDKVSLVAEVSRELAAIEA
jgi:adenosine deaminase